MNCQIPISCKEAGLTIVVIFLYQLNVNVQICVKLASRGPNQAVSLGTTPNYSRFFPALSVTLLTENTPNSSFLEKEFDFRYNL